jgi:hypothetical protein
MQYRLRCQRQASAGDTLGNASAEKCAYWCFQVTVNAPLLTADGRARMSCVAFVAMSA